MLAGESLDAVKALFLAEYENAGQPKEMAVVYSSRVRRPVALRSQDLFPAVICYRRKGGRCGSMCQTGARRTGLSGRFERCMADTFSAEYLIAAYIREYLAA
jgi:hypothetical protein